MVGRHALKVLAGAVFVSAIAALAWWSLARSGAADPRIVRESMQFGEVLHILQRFGGEPVLEADPERFLACVGWDEPKAGYCCLCRFPDGSYVVVFLEEDAGEMLAESMTGPTQGEGDWSGASGFDDGLERAGVLGFVIGDRKADGTIEWGEMRQELDLSWTEFGSVPETTARGQGRAHERNGE